ncbi:MAG: alcohol dehydrogenase catalytic domain-containing protein [Planctomycetota bacterium]|jgi:NADPH2:quinone reductase|nr:alcohol dehydrogenase catalytic domain-containing protein [Planctomycetota bacterium]
MMTPNTLEENRTYSKPTAPAMRAVQYDQYGDAEVLHVGDHSIPLRSTGQLMIQVHASSLNPIDYRLRRGDMKGLIPFGFPRIPGYDVAGVVVDADTDSSLKVGDRVMAFLDHTRGGVDFSHTTTGDNRDSILTLTTFQQDNGKTI